MVVQSILIIINPAATSGKVEVDDEIYYALV